MPNSIMPGLFLLSMAVTMITVKANGQPPKYTHDVKVKYFTEEVEMHCDHIKLNISEKTAVKSFQWIFPDGSLVDVRTPLNPMKYKLLGINDTSTPTGQRFMGYTLKTFNVDEDAFGYYTCIVVLPVTSSGASASVDTVVAIRWGLNVNGADFSHLIETYKENAIVGGIAAAVVLVLLVCGFLIWHYCCNNDNKYEDDHVRENNERESGSKHVIEMHENAGYINDMDGKQSVAKNNVDEQTSGKDNVEL